MLKIDAGELNSRNTAQEALVRHYADLAEAASKARSTYGVALDCLDRIAVMQGFLKHEALTARQAKLPNSAEEDATPTPPYAF